MFSADVCPPQPCHVNSTRRRGAYPLRQPGAEKACPPTEETEACTLNSNCFHYSYNITGEQPEASSGEPGEDSKPVLTCPDLSSRLEHLPAQRQSRVWRRD